MQSWIEQYGYWAVFVGGILEGETTFLLAGYAVSQGYLHPFATFLAAVAGGCTGDNGYYWLGRLHGPTLMRRFPFLRRLRARATLLLRRWGRATAFLTRFFYGLRIVLPMSMGAARFRFPLFFLFELMGSLAFAAIYLSLGYLFGETLQEFLGRIRPYEKFVVAGLLLLGAVVWAVREWKLLHPRPEEIEAETAEEPEVPRPTA
ncbi:MAG: DedA family protein [Gemmatimonadetes bacterium]|nr:DedA family protein [Gemmatimonadota bacterium]